jgi:hypothetical protein
MSKEALKLALEALEEACEIVGAAWTWRNEKGRPAITAIKQALAAPVQEPFGYFRYDMRLDAWVQSRADKRGVAFYTTPPAAQRQWIGLTDKDIEQEFGFIDELLRDCVYRTEAKLKEKNT